MKLKFSIVQHSHDNWPVAYEMEWEDLARRLVRHDEATEKDGVAIIAATFTAPPRGKDTLLERWLVGIDVEYRPEHNGLIPMTPDLLAHRLAVERQAAVIWTTYGHTPELPRYRVMMPLSAPVRCLQVGRRVDNLLVPQISNTLGLNGMIDTGKYGAESLFYLARHPKGSTVHWSKVVEGSPINSANAVAVATMYDLGYRMEKAQLDALRKSAEFPPELKQIIEAFNDGHEVTDLLAQYGYKRQGDRFKSQYQNAGSQAATALFPDRCGWYSWSESDKAAGLGHVNDDGIFGDAFSLFVHYEHGNNFRAAIAALRERYGPKEGSS